MLESIKEQLLQSDKPLSNEELERLKKLVRPVESGYEGRETESRKEEIGWINVFRKPQLSDGDAEMSKWDQKDLQECA